MTAGGDDTLKIAKGPLAQALGCADATATASAATAIVTTGPAAKSQLDAVAVSISTLMEGVKTKVDTTDSVAATKQLAALTESPPAIFEQDLDGAAKITAAAPTPRITTI